MHSLDPEAGIEHCPPPQIMKKSGLNVTARAPGKLFWLGEYAVLYGGPAIVQAVDRYVSVSVTSSGNAEQTTLRIRAPESSFPELQATLREQTLNYQGRQPAHNLVVTVLEALTSHGILHDRLGAIECIIDSRELFNGQHKLGLGSSAAVTHALIRALTDYASMAMPERAKTLSDDFVFHVHRAFQHGRGSGADIAAGVTGGTCLFQRVSGHTLPLMRTVTVPRDLHTVAVWAGTPASTTAALAGLRQYQDRHPGGFSAALTPLLELAEQGATTLESGDSEGFVRVCDLYGHNLSEFGRTVGVDIMSSAHCELRRIAGACGVVYKPSGAGNGDFGLGYSLDIKALQYFERRVRHAGFTPVAMGPGLPCHRS